MMLKRYDLLALDSITRDIGIILREIPLSCSSILVSVYLIGLSELSRSVGSSCVCSTNMSMTCKSET